MIFKFINIINQKIFMIIFVFCILISCISIFIVHTNQIIFEQIDEFEDIETKFISKNNNKYSLSIEYPHTTNKRVNKEITNFINIYIIKTEEDMKYFFPKSEDEILKLNIDYECERINKDIVTFIFLIKYYNNTQNIINLNTLSYNLRTGKKINLESFFKENSNYLQILCEKSKEYLINSETLDNKVMQFFIDDISYMGSKSFDGYSFSINYLSVYFNTNKISHENNLIYEVKIPWKNIPNLLKDNVYLLDEK